MKRPAKKSLPFRIVIWFTIFLFLFIVLPIYLIIANATHPFKLSLEFFLLNGIILFYLSNKVLKRKYYLKFQVQKLQEKINILNDQNSRQLINQSALLEKIERYRGLKNVVEQLNRSLDFDTVAESIVEIAFSSVANNKGACILYLLDKELNLEIFKTKKEARDLIIKAKQGDIFDLWVLRHTSPLLLEDIKKDFRFDLEKLKAQDLRPIGSLIISPLLSEHRFIGILRLDSPRPNDFTQEDLRFLATVSDLGAMALENSELFGRTKGLAIHDSLTSLFTKGHFLERLDEELKRCGRMARKLSLLMLDIDHFKNYNDKFGHIAGDIVLKKISRKISDYLKAENPIIGRFGGEEFCIAFTHNIDKKKAVEVAEKLRREIEQEKIILRREETNITVSIGVASFPLEASNAQELIRAADTAMYKAKEKGRNQVCSI